MTAIPYSIEARTQEIGERLFASAREFPAGRGGGDRWINGLLERSMENERFRVQALRFVDVLPVLVDDSDLVKLLREYFAEGELPLPGIARWGIAHAADGVSSRLLAGAVRKTMEILARHFLGGADTEEAMETVRRLGREGASASLDRLGEAVVSEVEADGYLQACLESLERMAGDTAQPVSPGSLNLSVKISSLYSRFTARDPEGSVAGILSRLRPLLRKARSLGVSVCLDMEHYDLKHINLRAFREVFMEEEFRDWPDAGIALQTYLRETEQDLRHLMAWAVERGTPVTVRLVRGAYWDQETVLANRQGWPIPVWTRKDATDRCFERCLTTLFESGGGIRPAIASHNLRSLALTMSLAEQHSPGPDGFEFQMLYGMGEDLRSAVLSMGYPVRVYVPFGRLLPGMAYLVRRLLENSSSQSFLRMGSVPRGSGRELLAPPPDGAGEGAGESSCVEPAVFANEPVHRFTGDPERHAMHGALEKVSGELGRRYPLFIGGGERDTGNTIVSINPARPGERIGEVAAAGKEEAEEVVNAALDALPGWRDTDPTERAAHLRRIAALLRERRDEFAAWEIFEAGKPWAEADADVAEAIDFLEYYSREARRLIAGMAVDVAGETNRYTYTPRGVGVVIPPWNFPLAILAGMLSAAIVTGNTAILKPSSQTPVVAARFMALLREARLPDGVVNFLPGPGVRTGETLVSHPQVHFIAFTGSVEVGTRINRLAAEIAPGQQHVKRVIAEMGGKNAIIVDNSADLDQAVLGTVASAFGYQGQKCSACSRVIVVGAAYDLFLPRLLDAVASLPVGLPENPGTVVGPVIEEAARDRILHTIEEAQATATLLVRVDVGHLEPGFFVGPAVFGDVPADSVLAQEEIFGPVLAVLRAPDFDEALALANGTRFALTGGVYSRSPANLARARREFHVGNLYFNRGITGALVGRQPFGGFRLSGVGSKAGGPDYLLQFMEPRTITENTLRRGLAPSTGVARDLEKSHP